MKKRNEIASVLLPLVITISIYVVFSSRIESKPNHAGFWIILALGMALGVALTRLIMRIKQ
jgi:hypothetical protein